MTIDEISTLVAQRLLQGAMNHEQFVNYYDFLGLQGYKCYHEYHFLEEMCGYRKFICYYIESYNRLVPPLSFDSFSSFKAIPENWYSYTREDVDLNTKRNAVKNGLQKYVRWEKDTKAFLEDMYAQAMSQSCVALAIHIEEYIKSVEEEIKLANKTLLENKATDYDLPTIITKQEELAKKYCKKLSHMRKEFNHDESV